MKSPCHDCEHKNTDKNNSICTECEKRVNYVAALGIFPDGPETEKRRDAMSKAGVRGTCKNCKRENMSSPARGLCGACNYAWVNAPWGGKEAALAAVRARVDSGENLRSSRSGRPRSDEALLRARKEAAETIKANSYKNRKHLLPPADEKGSTLKVCEGWMVPGAVGIAITFVDERDKQILAVIEAQASEHRRNPEQEILWILQHYVEAEVQESGARSQEPDHD